MTANVKGKIYYTRNGSTPTNKSKLYKDNEVLTICIKTQINAIVVTENNITSKITHYQSEQILTPPISVVVPQTDLINNQQTLNFTTNWDNTTIYYTTDGSNPKSNTKIKYNNKTFKINKNTTLKYYTKDNLEGYESIVYTYNTPKYTQERPTLTIINTTRMYSDNHQRIMIQSNQPTTIEYYKYWGTNDVIHKKYTKELDTSKNTQLIITGKHKTTGQMASQKEYMPTKGTRTIMNYTYALSMPYPDGAITLNEKYYLNLTSEKNNFESFSLLYNYRKNNIEGTLSRTITEPGMLVYTTNNNKILNIKLYGYAYGDINQVSVLSTTELYNEEILLITKFSTIVNGKINQTIFFLLPDMNQLSDDDKDATPINTSFTSNYQNYTLNKKDKLNHLFTITEIMPFQTLQTYIITNRLINKDDIQQTINKNKTYTKNENKTFTNINEMEVDKTDHLKAAYGTYLTGETIIYFNDEMSKFYGSYNNVTFTRADDTQILVGVNHHGTIYSNIYDPTLSTKITNNPTVNQTVQFRFMTTVMMSEWERQALRLSMQNITSPLYIFFEDVRLNNNNVNFTIDEKTGIITIEPTTNQTYYIEIDLKTGIVKTMMKTEEEGEKIKGATSQIGQGYCYHGENTDELLNMLNKLNNFTSNDFTNDFMNTLRDCLNEITPELESTMGTTLITAGTLMLSSGPGSVVGVSMIIGGLGLCYLGAGESISDPLNPYYWADAAPSVIAGLIPFIAEDRMILSLTKLAVKSSPVRKASKISLIFGFNNAAPENMEDYMCGKAIDQVISSNLKQFLTDMNVSKGSYNKIRSILT